MLSGDIKWLPFFVQLESILISFVFMLYLEAILVSWFCFGLGFHFPVGDNFKYAIKCCQYCALHEVAKYKRLVKDCLNYPKVQI